MTKADMFYQVAMPEPQLHLFEVTLQISNWDKKALDLKMPVWTPGSYLVREYARHVQDFKAVSSSNNQSLLSRKIAKNHWQVITENQTGVTIKYRVFANELTVRTNHLDATHGYFNGAALFMFVPELVQEPIQVEIIPPKPEWKVTTTLVTIPEKTNTFIAQDFDTLVDNPVEVGKQEIHNFEVLGKSHQYAIWGKGNTKITKIIKDTKKIIETEAEIFGGLPYEKYLFLLHLSGSGYGGLEHKECCTLNYPRLGFRDQDKYHRFIQLVAHEFFHLWNVKRIRPKALETFNYEQENYTTSLWFSEGVTSYYDMLIPLRAGIYNRKKFLNNLSKDITRYLSIPGRKVQPLGESSFDAWIKLYRREAHSDNNQISYYLKGELVALLLDLLIRNKHHNQKSLDDVMRMMWERYGKAEIGFTPEDLQQVFEDVAQQDLSDFFTRYLETTEALPFDDYLAPFGLKIKPIHDKEAIPYLGIRVQTEGGKEIIKFTEANSPAAIAGIDPNDEFLAINGIRVTADTLNEHLKDYHPGNTITITIFHQDELLTVSATLAEPQPTRYEVVQIENASETQQQNLAGWLG
ncbi:MAG: M61 family metallopeptidase [Xenococcaceae cyanobacterium MO_234.B1]|nr:M61 family metallopeptidase [Xenococcaceae cyanobacterium MO_234.B1]